MKRKRDNDAVLSIVRWADLPHDMHVLITSFIDEISCVVLYHCSKEWRLIIQSNLFTRRTNLLPKNGFLKYHASKGHLGLVKWGHENNCPWDKWRTCARAARGGHLETLKWARENGCPWNKWRTCDRAARGGHLETLKWARKNGCPWDKWTCARAARGGHLETLKWARENGCPWDKLTCDYAARGGHHELLAWAIANGCPQ